MAKKSPTFTEIPLNVVGSNIFGRYPKISIEKTYNMIISDKWLVPTPGHELIKLLKENVVGRAIFNSSRYRHLMVIVDSDVYIIDLSLSVAKIGNIDTYNGDVFITENNANQIAICDKQHIYIFDYNASTFQKVTTDFRPIYIDFHNGYFVAAVANEPKWRLSALNNGTSWPANPENVGEFETKPDNVKATVAFPGHSNLLMVMGEIVSELWTNVGAALFPYQRNSAFNIDYGCISSSTIAKGDKFIIWLGVNEKSGLAIMYSDGGETRQVSNDGINFFLGTLRNPRSSYGFMYKQDGHLIYQLTFSDQLDNVTIIYDFATNAFFYMCDEYMDRHIAKSIAFFNGEYYFVGIADGGLYRFSADLTTYNNAVIPRIRVCKNIRLPDSSQFIVNNLTFTLEQGQSKLLSRIDLSVSRDGGESFGDIYGIELNDSAHRANKLTYWQLGYANDFIPQFRFWGHDRFVATDGIVSVYQ